MISQPNDLSQLLEQLAMTSMAEKSSEALQQLALDGERDSAYDRQVCTILYYMFIVTRTGLKSVIEQCQEEGDYEPAEVVLAALEHDLNAIYAYAIKRGFDE